MRVSRRRGTQWEESQLYINVKFLLASRFGGRLDYLTLVVVDWPHDWIVLGCFKFTTHKVGNLGVRILLHQPLVFICGLGEITPVLMFKVP